MKLLRKQLKSQLPPESGELLRVHLCGLLRVETPDRGEITITSAKGRAIIAYLCLSRDGKASRRDIAEHLWVERDPVPESDDAEDTNASEPRLTNLREELKKLRRALGPHAQQVLQADRETIRIDLGRVWTDTRDMLLAILDGSAPPPVAGVESDRLLAGFKPLTNKFRDWLDGQRDEFAIAKGRAFAQRAAQVTEQQLPIHLQIAEHRKLFDFDPTDEENCRKLMKLLMRAGSYSTAAQVYRRCKEMVGIRMKARPEVATSELYRAIEQRLLGQAPPPQDQGAKRQLIQHDKADTVYAPRVSTLPQRPDDGIKVGIRPILNLTGDTMLDAAAVSIFDELLTDLPMLLRPFSVVELPPADEPLTPAEARCRYVIEVVMKGGTRALDGQLRLNLQITHRSSARVARGNRASHDAKAALGDSRALSNRLASKIYLALVTEQSEQLASLPHETLSDAELVVLGISKLRRSNTLENMLAARAFLEAVLARNACNVDALTGLAHIHHRLASQPWASETPGLSLRKGRAYIDAALEIDPLHAQATYVSAMLSSMEGEPGRAALAFDRLLDMTASLPALGYRGYNNIFMNKPKSGLEDIKRGLRGLQDDPSLPIWHLFEGIAELHCGNLDGAITALSDSINIDPRYGSARLWIAGSQYIGGRRSEAKAHMETFRARHPAYTLSEFEATWGASRTHDTEYLARNRVVADALIALDLPRG